jgi:hypothetical protein
MATATLVNEYANPALQKGGIDSAVYVNGAPGYFATIEATINPDTRVDAEGSEYILFPGVQDRMLLVSLNLNCDVTMTAGVLYKIILTDPNTGAELADLSGVLDFNSDPTIVLPKPVDWAKSLLDYAEQDVLTSPGRYNIVLKSVSSTLPDVTAKIKTFVLLAQG